MRIVSFILSAVLFFGDSVFAYSTETNIWQERLQTSGTVRKIIPPLRDATGGTVIHIQDVHRNAEAQRHIGDAVARLIIDGRIGLVALEGASGLIDLTPFHEFPHPDTTKKTADYLLKENRISGPVHALMLSPVPVPVFGVDDSAHYRANIEAYKAAARMAPDVKLKLESENKRLESEKIRTFNPALLAFDQHVASYRSGALPLGSYARLLPRDGSPALDLFLQALDVEESLNFPQADKERGALLAVLTRKLNPDETSELIRLTMAHRLGRVGAADFYARIGALCAKHGVHLARYPAMNAYFNYVALTARIDTGRLSYELHAAEEKRAAELARSADERALTASSRRIYLKRKLADFSLTAEEWQEYGLSKEKSDFRPFEKFYEEAKKRDRLMAENLLRRMQPGRSALLVTGGFHSAGIDRLLAEAGHTVVTFVPKLSQADGGAGAAALSAFAREKTPLDQLFQGEKLFLAGAPFPENPQAIGGLMDALEHRMGRPQTAALIRLNESLGVPSHETRMDPPGPLEALYPDGRLSVWFGEDNEILRAYFEIKRHFESRIRRGQITFSPRLSALLTSVILDEMAFALALINPMANLAAFRMHWTDHVDYLLASSRTMGDFYQANPFDYRAGLRIEASGQIGRAIIAEALHFAQSYSRNLSGLRGSILHDEAAEHLLLKLIMAHTGAIESYFTPIKEDNPANWPEGNHKSAAILTEQINAELKNKFDAGKISARSLPFWIRECIRLLSLGTRRDGKANNNIRTMEIPTDAEDPAVTLAHDLPILQGHEQWHGLKLRFTKTFKKDIETNPEIMSSVLTAIGEIQRKVAIAVQAGQVRPSGLRRYFGVENLFDERVEGPNGYRIYFSLDLVKKKIVFVAFLDKKLSTDGHERTMTDFTEKLRNWTENPSFLLHARALVSQLIDDLKLDVSTPSVLKTEEKVAEPINRVLELLRTDHANALIKSVAAGFEKKVAATHTLAEALQVIADSKELSAGTSGKSFYDLFGQLSFLANGTSIDALLSREAALSPSSREALRIFLLGWQQAHVRAVKHLENLIETEFFKEAPEIPDFQKIGELFGHALTVAPMLASFIREEFAGWLEKSGVSSSEGKKNYDLFVHGAGIPSVPTFQSLVAAGLPKTPERKERPFKIPKASAPITPPPPQKVLKKDRPAVVVQKPVQAAPTGPLSEDDLRAALGHVKVEQARKIETLKILTSDHQKKFMSRFADAIGRFLKKNPNRLSPEAAEYLWSIAGSERINSGVRHRVMQITGWLETQGIRVLGYPPTWEPVVVMNYLPEDARERGDFLELAIEKYLSAGTMPPYFLKLYAASGVTVVRLAVELRFIEQMFPGQDLIVNLCLMHNHLPPKASPSSNYRFLLDIFSQPHNNVPFIGLSALIADHKDFRDLLDAYLEVSPAHQGLKPTNRALFDAITFSLHRFSWKIVWTREGVDKLVSPFVESPAFALFVGLLTYMSGNTLLSRFDVAMQMGISSSVIYVFSFMVLLFFIGVAASLLLLKAHALILNRKVLEGTSDANACGYGVAVLFVVAALLLSFFFGGFSWGLFVIVGSLGYGLGHTYSHLFNNWTRPEEERMSAFGRLMAPMVNQHMGTLYEKSGASQKMGSVAEGLAASSALSPWIGKPVHVNDQPLAVIARGKNFALLRPLGKRWERMLVIVDKADSSVTAANRRDIGEGNILEVENLIRADGAINLAALDAILSSQRVPQNALLTFSNELSVSDQRILPGSSLANLRFKSLEQLIYQLNANLPLTALTFGQAMEFAHVLAARQA